MEAPVRSGLLYGVVRFLLADEENNSTTADSPRGDEDPSSSSPSSDGQVLWNTFSVYGSIMIVALLSFCYLRQRYPRPYQVRDWVREHQTYLAKERYGWFSWIWEHNKISDVEILRECGLDSLCFLRLLVMGYKVAFFCALQSMWLIPIYRYSVKGGEVSADRVEQITMAHIPFGSSKLIATVVAAYFIFLYFMYLIHKEFDWFIEMRHLYLKLGQPSNYTVHVRNIPPELCTNARLTQYFRKCLSDTAVYEVRLRIKTKQLAAAVQKRAMIVQKFEHALNYESVKGEPPTHREYKLLSSSSSTPDFQQVDSISTYAAQLREANRDITQRITAIEENHFNNAMDLSNDSFQSCDMPNNNLEEEEDDDEIGALDEAPEATEATTLVEDVEATNGQRILSTRMITGMVGQGAGLFAHTAKSGVGILTKTTKSGVGMIANTAGTVAKTATTAILGAGDEGEYMTAGFVSFRTLRQKNAALQMLHHSQPFTIEVVEAPEPDDIFWANVGRTHKDLQIGNLISRAGTAALCFFWTIPMAFIATLKSADAIGAQFPFLSFLIKYPIVVAIIDLLAPLLVKIVNNMLPTILTYLTMFEGPVSGSVVASSLFAKLAYFMIVQTFFVQAISGSIVQEIKKMVDDPSLIISLFAMELPGQSIFFIQIVFVGTAISLTMEMLRVVPLAMALIRRFLLPNLTEKERQTTAFGIRPLADPSEFELASSLAQIILNFVIMLVYAVIAPLTVFIQGFCFLAMYVCYRHQFIYIYPKKPDSGGACWTNFVKIIMLCTLIAEVTLMGFLGIMKSTIGTPLMIPLIVITVLFNGYIRQQHFRVAEFLPSRDCLKADERNGDMFDLSFLDAAYLQDELREKRVLPENLPAQRAYDLELVDQVDQLISSDGL